MIHMAALQGVSTEMYEAADIDGARFFQKLFYITIPSIRNTIYVTLLLRVIWVANSIDIIQNMTAGGPAYATQTIGIYVYQKASIRFRPGSNHDNHTSGRIGSLLKVYLPPD